MLQKTQGIVLSHIKYSETSIICKIYTEALGIRTYIINSVRSSKPKNKAVFFQPLTRLNMVVYEKMTGDIHRIKEYGPDLVFQSIPFDVIKSSLAIFISEVLSKSIKEQEANSALFEFLSNTIDFLEQTEGNLGNFSIYFLLDLTKYLGFYPNNNFTEENSQFSLTDGVFAAPPQLITRSLVMSVQMSELLSKMLGKDIMTILKTPITRENRKEMLQWLIRYYEHQISNFPELKSLSVLETVLS